MRKRQSGVLSAWCEILSACSETSQPFECALTLFIALLLYSREEAVPRTLVRVAGTRVSTRSTLSAM